MTVVPQFVEKNNRFVADAVAVDQVRWWLVEPELAREHRGLLEEGLLISTIDACRSTWETAGFPDTPEDLTNKRMEFDRVRASMNRARCEHITLYASASGRTAATVSQPKHV